MKVWLPLAVALLGTAMVASGAVADTVKQTIQLAKVDVTQVAAGYRASKVIGSSVVNDANESIGSIDDLLVSQDGKETFAVLSVGGFLGLGSKLDASINVLDRLGVAEMIGENSPFAIGA